MRGWMEERDIGCVVKKDIGVAQWWGRWGFG
jgi:hypothetical protein